MKEIKEEAKRHHEAKLHKYGADHKACGGSMKKYASGGHVHAVDLECKGKTGPEIRRAHGGAAHHPNREKDLHLIEELEHDHMKKHGGHVKHRDMGGPVAGGPGPRLGRGRKGGKKGTNVNVVVAGKGDGPAPTPPALGAGPSLGVPSAPPPRPIMPPPAAGPAGLPPRPGMGVKHGGKVEHKKHHEHKRHERHHGHRGH